MAAAPCKDCGVRPKLPGRHRCLVCATRIAPIGEQVEESRRRASLVPAELRLKRVPESKWPRGTRWCAGCQSFVDLVDVPASGSRCRACSSAASHSARIEKVYGLSSADYDALLASQGGRCAIGRERPKGKRLAVDHDHKTGEVRGLLCSRCNHDLLGAGFDSVAKLGAATHYLMHPPTSGAWWAPEDGLVVDIERPGAVRPSKPLTPEVDLFATVGGSGAPRPQSSDAVTVSLPTLDEAKRLGVVELTRLLNWLEEQRLVYPPPF